MRWSTTQAERAARAPRTAARLRQDIMTQYPEDFKAALIARLLPPTNASIPELAQETGVPQNTLYAWRSKNRGQGTASSHAADSTRLSSSEKFTTVLETASMTEIERGEYCRAKGLFPEQIQQWHRTCSEANAMISRRAEHAQVREHKRTIKQLQSELNRKEKALAETAALLVLRKKAQALWGEVEDEKSPFQSADK